MAEQKKDAETIWKPLMSGGTQILEEGDSVTGLLVHVDPIEEPNRYLTLFTAEGGMLRISLSTGLRPLAHVAGKGIMVRITCTGEQRTASGGDMKLYRVEYAQPPAALKEAAMMLLPPSVPF